MDKTWLRIIRIVIHLADECADKMLSDGASARNENNNKKNSKVRNHLKIDHIWRAQFEYELNGPSVRFSRRIWLSRAHLNCSHYGHRSFVRSLEVDSRTRNTRWRRRRRTTNNLEIKKKMYNRNYIIGRLTAISWAEEKPFTFEPIQQQRRTDNQFKYIPNQSMRKK